MLSEGVKKMADILRSGATMLSETCPQCFSPLFKLPSNEVYCVNCDRKVVIVRDEEDMVKAYSPTVLASLEDAILSKLRDVEEQIRQERDAGALQPLMSFVGNCLDVLERIKKVRAE